MDHPDGPTEEEMGEYVIDAIDPDKIQKKREDGLTLVEENLLEHEDVDAFINLNDPGKTGMVDVGTVLYRLIQIFGTPQMPEYQAGNDISWRTDETFKYLLRVRKGVDQEAIAEGKDEDLEADGEWLVTVFDHRVRLGVGLAKWDEDPDATVEVVPEEVIPIMAIIKHGVEDPVECVFKEIRF